MINPISILFLLRSYNDIDHIVPMVWKCRSNGLRCYFVFTGKNFTEDYRIQFITQAGAVNLTSQTVTIYFQQIRSRLRLRIVKKVADTFVERIIGNRLLKKNNIDVVVTEWSGALGREMSRYYLRPAYIKKLPVYSVPHGYNIYKNLDVSRTLRNQKRATGNWPDFSSRNAFRRYVVQNEHTKTYCVSFGVKEKNIVVLGSARFCREWVNVNSSLLENYLNYGIHASCKIAMFFPQWDYNIDRSACFSLLSSLSEMSEVFITVKGTTREMEGLYDEEKEEIRNLKNVKFVENNVPSPTLIHWSDLVINFASSIGLEAIMQKKLVCNPRYLHSNDSIFDESGVVIDCFSESDVNDIVRQFLDGECLELSKLDREKFYSRYILGNDKGGDVLEEYVRLFATGEGGVEM